MRSIRAEVVFPSACELGEGSLWDVQHQLLYWVDISGHKVFAFDPRRHSNLAYDVGESVGTVVLTQNEKLLLALRSGVAVLDPATGSLRALSNPRPPGEKTRFNDGKCDPRGRFFAGTTVEGGGEPIGALYRFDTDGAAFKLIEGVRISNGLVWTKDASRFYYIDTPTQQIWVYDFDVASGTIANRRVAFEIPNDQGGPDGMAIDAEDHLWLALYGGGKVVRIDPATSTIDYEVIVPARNTTSCAFGGKELDELYVTTARQGLSSKDLEREPLSGSLFRVRVPFRGVPAARFAANL